MNLTDGEKLIAAMLADLMKRVGGEGELDPDFILSSLGGHAWSIRSKYDGLFGHEADPGVVRETGRIMTMWSILESRIAALGGPEDPRWGDREKRFEGFDANDGEGHYGVATRLIEMGRFSNFADRYINSHGSTRIEAQRRQLAKWDEVWAARPDAERLDEAAIKAIIDARRHPSA